VLVLDHSDKVAEKVRISGGGRANFTNRDIDPRQPHKHFISENPQLLPLGAVALHPGRLHGPGAAPRHARFHEKHKGQLFCDRSADDLIQMLLRECEAGGVTRWQPCGSKPCAWRATAATNSTPTGTVRSQGGGRHRRPVHPGSAPPTSATGWPGSSACALVEPRPGLVPLTFDGDAWAPYAELAGLALPVAIETGAKKNRAASPKTCCSPTAACQARPCCRSPATGAGHTDPHQPGARGRPARRAGRGQAAHRASCWPTNWPPWVPSRLADAWVAQDADWQRPVASAATRR
jgi:predicted flavoprotein YhiN